mmetsp:Transcript_5979/g.6440  ORF Transcript_5979/g.6440 Transcript_5979/m.6440 type:complete len:84 (+) Transcript_5979:296-547(+)
MERQFVNWTRHVVCVEQTRIWDKQEFKQERFGRAMRRKVKVDSENSTKWKSRRKENGVRNGKYCRIIHIEHSVQVILVRIGEW